MDNNFFQQPGYNPLRFTPQMPYAQLPGLANTRGQYGIQSPNYIDPNQNAGAQYQIKPQWQFGINYNHLAFSNAVQGVGAFLRSNNQRRDFAEYNKIQQNPLSQLPENPNNTQQALYGDKQYKKGGKVKYEDGGPIQQPPIKKPIKVTNPNDRRLADYQDSLRAYNSYIDLANFVKKNPSLDKINNDPKLSNTYGKLSDLNGQGNWGANGNGKVIQPTKIDHPYSGKSDEMWEFAKPIQPVLYSPSNNNPPIYTNNQNDPKRSQIQGRVQIPNDRSQISQPTGGPGSLAGVPTNYSFTGRNDQGQQDTRYFSDLDSWKAATDRMGYSNREVSGDNKKASATGYQFAEGGQFDNFDDFDEDDFQDLKEELDNYFKDRGNKPIENLTEDRDDDQPESQEQPEQEDTYKPTGAMDFLNQQQPDYEAQDKSDKDIMDELAGTQPIPQPESQQSQDSHPSIEAFKNGIARVENAGYSEGNKNSTAFGKYQFTAPTREGVRQQFFSTISKKDFEDAYRSDPKFQEKVMDVYGNHLLNAYDGDPHKAATAFFLGPGKVDKYNQPDYNPGHGNVSVGKYLSTFDQGYNKKGGGYITSPGSISTGFDVPYNFKMEEGGQGPGDGKRPTSADSLAIYNNSKKVEDYYINNKYAKYSEKPSGFTSQFMTKWNDINAKSFANSNNTLTENGIRKVPMDEYRKDINENQYYQREMADAVLDTRAPMGLYDKRIAPQLMARYDATPNTPNENLKQDGVEIYKYDPIAMKPWNTLTPDERKIRIEKYGDPTKQQTRLDKPIDLINQTVKPAFIPPSMNKSQVQSAGSLRSPYGPVQGSPMIPRQLSGQNQTPYSFTGRDDNGQETTRYFNDLDTWRQATDKMGYANRQVNGDNKSAQATGYQFKEGGEYELSHDQIAILKKQGYKFDII